MSWTYRGDSSPKAMKDYKCHLCGEIIPCGEIHVARRGVTEDGPVTLRMHAECEDASQSWSPEEWECSEPGDLERPAELEYKPMEDGEDTEEETPMSPLDKALADYEENEKRRVAVGEVSGYATFCTYDDGAKIAINVNAIAYVKGDTRERTYITVLCGDQTRRFNVGMSFTETMTAIRAAVE